MDERERLLAAIAAQEALRGTVPDDIVDTTVAALRSQLDHDGAATRPKRRKLVTVVFADVSGSTELAERIDAEELSDRFDVLWHHLDAVVERHGGRIDKHIGDAVMAVWGADRTREDDPERAIRAALAMHATVRELADAGVVSGLRLRIGVNTGPVVLGAIASTDEYTAMGDAVNVAARLEAAAPPGAILVGHDTYRHVRGLFTVTAREPLEVKGKRAPLRTYLVTGSAPRGFQRPTPPIEGVQTSMIGRDAELDELRRALSTAVERSTPVAVTIVGDAGTGKSRLVREFEDWLRAGPLDVWLYTGRADPGRRGAPYALVRDVLLERFGIAEDASPELALAKLALGLRRFGGDDLAAEAQVVGDLVGLESGSPLGAQELVERASAALVRLLARSAATMPVVVLVEDLHWADRASLDLLERLRRELSGEPILLVGLTRPHADRGGLDGDRTIVLEPLSDHDTGLLVDDLLQLLPDVPDELREEIVGVAAGHPFFVEELVRMMIDDGVIVTGDQWELRPELLGRRRIPPTVAGVIAARLDLLTEVERAVLQRASVVGPVFSEASIPRSRCSTGTVPTDLGPTLDALASRGLVERNVGDGARADVVGRGNDHRFQHDLLREATYETVLRQDRQRLHRDVAEWMAERRDAPSSASAIAAHFAAADDVVEAARWFARAATEARRRCAVDEALDACRAALEADVLDATTTIGVLDDLCECLSIAARYDEALATADQMEQIAISAGDDRRRAWAMQQRSHLHIRQGRSRDALGEARRAHDLLVRAGADDDEVVGSLTELTWALLRLGRAHEAVERGSEALGLLQPTSDPRARRGVHSVLGAAHHTLGAFAEAEAHLAEALALDRLHADRRGEAANLVNLGEVARLRGDLPASLTRFREALAIVREIDDRDQETLVLSNLGGALVETGDIPTAMTHLSEAVSGFERTGGVEHSSETHRFLAEAHLAIGAIDDARRAARRALELAHRDENPDHLGHAWRVLGLVAARSGRDRPASDDGDEPDPHHCLTISVSVFEAASMERERALALADLADVVDAGGEAARARTLRDEVGDVLSGLGLGEVLARVETRWSASGRARPLGARSPSPP